MKHSTIKGFCFGLTSGIITTLGMMVGLHSSTGSKLVVVGGILSIAIADSFSDALGIHVSEEADKNKCGHEVWAATISTFISKILFSSTFILPVIFLPLSLAIKISIFWGLGLLGVLSYFIARSQKTNPWRVIFEHLLIATAVITITHFLGDWIHTTFA